MNSWYSNSWGFGPGVLAGWGFIAAITIIALLVLKGYSLWYAARRGEKWWFIILLIINTAGILELIYLIFVIRKFKHGTTDNAAKLSDEQVK